MSNVGALAANLHEGSRSEYLAQYVFASFGTAISVPPQEQPGIDLYCTMTERFGALAWPRHHYTVQVKSMMSPWQLTTHDSVRWLVEHPLPLFLCVVDKSTARLRLYHTLSRFLVWVTGELPDALELVPEDSQEGKCVQWSDGKTFSLSAPIIDRTIMELLDDKVWAQTKSVIDFWLQVEQGNLARHTMRVPKYSMPASYKSNEIPNTGTIFQSSNRTERIDLVRTTLGEILPWLADAFRQKNDLRGMGRAALLLRYLFPEYEPFGIDHALMVQQAINGALGLQGSYVFEGVDHLAKRFDNMVSTTAPSESNNADGKPNSPNPLIEMAMGYARSRALCAAARLGIADVMGDGEKTVDQLAAACHADPASLHRLLRALASFGIVCESQPGTFVLTSLGSPLRKDAPDSAWASIIFWADLLADSWSYLTECVRTCDTAGEVMRRAGVVSRWSADPEAPAIFRAVMGTGAAANYMPLARAWDFSASRVVADLGGGGGALLLAILEAYPNLRGLLVDRRESIDCAAPRFAAADLAQRSSLIAVDLCQAVPAGADVYVLKHVLHAHCNDTAVGILQNCRSVIPPKGRLLVIEFVLPDLFNRVDKDLELRVMSDLNMLAVTGGKERTAAEWNDLLLRSRFELLRIIAVPGESASIIEAAPVG